MTAADGRHYHQCAECGITTLARSDLCRDCGRNDDAKSCLMCGAITKTDERHCKSCMRHIREAAAHVDKPRDGLGLGTWVTTRGGVRVWEGAKVLETPAQARARMAREESRYDAADVQRARAAYRRGDRTPWAVIGHRIYRRRQSARRREAA